MVEKKLDVISCKGQRRESDVVVGWSEVVVEVASEVVVVVVEKEVEKKEEKPRETGNDRVAVSPRGAACARSRPTQVDAWTIVRPVRDDLRIWNMKQLCGEKELLKQSLLAKVLSSQVNVILGYRTFSPRQTPHHLPTQSVPRCGAD